MVDKKRLKRLSVKVEQLLNQCKKKQELQLILMMMVLSLYFGQNQSSMKACLEIIESILEEPELDKVYKGTVVKIVDFGAFVNILPGKDGLLHISEIAHERTEDVSAVLSEGQEIDVKLIGFDRGKMKLSAKALIEKSIPEEPETDRSSEE